MTVSVIIPSYNHARFLTQRIDSVINQTFRDFEIIILDDCSSDGSREIIETYCDRYSFIKCYYNDVNSGSPFSQWNSGVEKANGEYIWVAESDDYADAAFLEKSVAVLSENLNVGIVYCDSKVIDENEGTEYLVSEKKFALGWKNCMNDYIKNGREEISDSMYLDNPIYNVSSVLFRKNFYLKAGGADHTMKFCGDLLLYIKILYISDIAYISLPLNTYRIHRDSSLNRYFRSNDYLKELIRVYAYVIKNSGLPAKKKSEIFSRLILTSARRIKHFLSDR
jgi:glycosyltransferase involved in cell wall biosynthesis